MSVRDQTQTLRDSAGGPGSQADKLDRVARAVGDLASWLQQLSDALEVKLPPSEDLAWAISYAERSRSHGNDALTDWLKEQRRKREAEPFIPSARKQGVPQGKSVVMVDEDGRKWAMDVNSQSES